MSSEKLSVTTLSLMRWTPTRVGDCSRWFGYSNSAKKVFHD